MLNNGYLMVPVLLVLTKAKTMHLLIISIGHCPEMSAPKLCCLTGVDYSTLLIGCDGTKA